MHRTFHHKNPLFDKTHLFELFRVYLQFKFNDMETHLDDLSKLLISKGELKQQIFHTTLDTMQMFKEAAKEFE